MNRLHLIASTSTVLAVDALKLAAHEILEKGKDVQQYRAICEDLRSLAPTDSDSQVNKQWVEQTDKANQAEQHRLESELKGYKNNLVKESIRVCIDAVRGAVTPSLTAYRWATRILQNTWKASASWP